MNCLAKVREVSAQNVLLQGTNDSSLPLGTERTMLLRDAALTFIHDEGGCHGIDHSERVHETSLFIGREMGAGLDVLSAASILHDIGRNDERKSQGHICHASRGAELARVILKEMDFDDSLVGDICHCIATHRFRDDNPPISLEAKILFDADKLDSIGAIGIGRAFLFAGQVGARLHNTKTDLIGSKPYTIEDTAYREFMVKLCKVKNRMITPLGKRLAEERHDFMSEFFTRLEKEIYGGTPDGRQS